MTTSALCATSAGFLMDQEKRDQNEHSIEVPVNPALQLLDVVTISDVASPTGTGLSKTARIIKNEARYNPDKAIYEMEVSLEGV